jgi:sugar phosphate isomerase/epimerase
MPELSLGPLTIIRANHREMVDAAAAGGFDAVGLRMIAPRPGDPVHPLVGDAAAIRALGQLMADQGLRMLDMESLWVSPTTEPASYRAAFEACAALGGRYVLCAGNDPDWGRLVDNFAQIAALAAEHGLTVGIEPTSWLAVSTLLHAQDLLRRAGAVNAGIIVDTLHMARVGETAASIAAVDPGLIAYAQICDAVAERPSSSAALMAEARTSRLLPGDGALPLAAMLEALPKDLPIGVEAPTLAFAGLPFDECARRAGRASRAFLAARSHSRQSHTMAGAGHTD